MFETLLQRITKMDQLAEKAKAILARCTRTKRSAKKPKLPPLKRKFWRKRNHPQGAHHRDTNPTKNTDIENSFPPAKKGVAAPPEYTTVYDAETQECKLITWEEYLKNNKAPPCSNYVTVYNPDTEEVDLIFWSQYVNMGLHAEDLAARKKS